MLALSAISWMIASLVPRPLFWTTLLDHLFVFWTSFLDRETTNFFLPSSGSDFFQKNEQRAISSKDTLRMVRFLQIEVYAFRQWLYLFPDHQICRAVFCSFALQSVDILKFSSESAQTRYLQR